jgi:hypothetical protein
MLSAEQAGVVEAYFNEFGRQTEADRKTVSRDPIVADAISQVWGAILDFVAENGQPIHRLPKQGDEQSSWRGPILFRISESG